ncbi:hypothetical protein [Oceanirhabdus sp. W0125-5]|uniref:hypothetical protein n=1 Tax=Oceanirhabdus sp. W0125-5 TaxID=2999116 RepID=UPI0022F2B5AD|nr:hypothetical protein [Oceanirhabdus sp. W0125-5]WBW97670.1 hypothetical protein OW730_02510 [Oceanirhabdus sp. W0125-5]
MNILLGTISVIFGISGLIYTYKNRNKVKVAEIFYPQSKYEVMDEKNFLKLQKVLGFLYSSYIIIIGILGTLVNTDFFLLACFVTLLFPLFLGFGEKYVRVKS